MALSTVFTQTLQHRMALTPAMREAISLLSLSSHDLTKRIDQEAQDNPLLEVEYSPPASGQSAYDIALSTTTGLQTFGDDLRNQLGLMPLDEDIRNIATYLVGDLNDEGFLDSDPGEIAQALGLSGEIIQRGIRALQSCEPTGVGARDLNECLLLQLVEHGLNAETASLVLRHIALFIQKDWAALCSHFTESRAELARIGELLKGLNPNPAQGFTPPEAPLIVDVLVTDHPQNGLTVALTNPNLPNLRVNEQMAQSLRGKPDVSTYLSEQENRAKMFIKAVEFRGKTILRVVRSIVSAQHRFFTDGQHFITPLTRNNIAKRLDLHPSTVGRAIADKNLAIDGAIYPIKFFFSSALGTKDQNPVSAHTVMGLIRKLILAETPQSTLSDQNIVDKLNAQGVDIARRTVAKYRGCMNIPSSPQRRQILVAKAAAPNGLGGAQTTRK